MYTNTGKSFAELRLSFAIDRFFDRLFSELPWIRENFFSAWSSRVLHTYDEFGNRVRVVLFAGSPIIRRSQCCLHANTSKFSSSWFFDQLIVVQCVPVSGITRVSGQKDAEIRVVRARNRLFTPHAGSRQRFLHDQSACFLLWKALWWSKATRTAIFAPWRTRK